MIKHAIKQVIREDSEQKYEFSAPIETFDDRVIKLTHYYNFDFEAAALHLSINTYHRAYEFPIYENKLDKKFVVKRWTELFSQREEMKKI